MGLIIDQREIVEGEIEDGAYRRIDLHARQWKRCAAELQLDMFEVVEIEVGVAQRVHEITGPQAGDLRDHQHKQRVRGDVEGDAEKEVGAALVELTKEPTNNDEKLEKGMTGRQRHVLD